MNKRELRGLVCAMLLGDGHLAKRDGVLIFEHSRKQEDYASWKADLLDDVFIAKDNPRRCRRRLTRQRCRGKYYDAYRVELYWMDYFARFLWPRCYTVRNGRKRKNIQYLLKQLESDLHLAIWFADDGGEMASAYGLFTYDFTLGENNLIAEWFHSRHKVEPKVTYFKPRDCHYLRFLAADARQIFERIGPHLEHLESMRCKFRRSFAALRAGEGSEAKREALSV